MRHFILAAKEVRGGVIVILSLVLKWEHLSKHMNHTSKMLI